jgi:hypothetical protein
MALCLCKLHLFHKMTTHTDPFCEQAREQTNMSGSLAASWVKNALLVVVTLKEVS